MKLEDQLRAVLPLKHYSLKTEESYVGWYRRFVLWHGKRHPVEMGAPEVEAFLTHLAVNLSVAATTQNQALNALVFFYREVLKMELEGIAASRAKHSKRLPVVLTQEETTVLMKAMAGDAGMVCRLLYGCGLRVAEALALRVKDVDLRGGKLEVRSGKGGKDRVITLPKSLLQPLKEHVARVQMLHEADRKAGLPGVMLPHALAVKTPGAGASWPWFWLFPSPSVPDDPRSGIRRRHLPGAGAGGEAGEPDQAGHGPYAEALVRHAPDPARGGHPFRAGTARPCGCAHDGDLLPSFAPHAQAALRGACGRLSRGLASAARLPTRQGDARGDHEPAG